MMSINTKMSLQPIYAYYWTVDTEGVYGKVSAPMLEEGNGTKRNKKKIETDQKEQKYIQKYRGGLLR
jgi:hypothetical protein